MKNKICKVCSKEFKPERIGQYVCSIPCAIIISKEKKFLNKSEEKRKKEERKKIRDLKEKIKTKSEYLKEAQAAVNKYVRLRDRDKPCISCGRFVEDKIGGNYDCGHYRSRKSAPHLRFNLNNMAKQCVLCNRYKSGAQLEFRRGLIERIGLERVEEIERNNDSRKFDIDYLKRIKKIFNKKFNKLGKRLNEKC